MRSMLPLLSSLFHLSYASPYSNCPAGWTDAFNLGLGCLYLVQMPLTWTEANSYCRNLGGHLVQLENQDQLQFLQQGLNFVDGTSWTSHHYWWTSAADQDDEGSWIWSNSKKNVADFLWAENEPDNCPDNSIGVCVGDENCGALVSNGEAIADYYLKDFDCDLSIVHNHHAPSFQIYSVCQMYDF